MPWGCLRVQSELMEAAILIHWAEIGLKGGNRPQFIRRLADRLRQGLESARIEGRIAPYGSRLLVTLSDADTLTRAMAVVTRIPGVANAAVAERVPSELEAIKEAAARRLVKAPPGSFKVESRRADKKFPLNSIELSQAVGGRCVATTERAVDVRRPDVVVRVEVLTDHTFVSAGAEKGPGGLPVGSTTRLLSFLSGGLDSPVATWLMIRRGARVSGVHFHNRTLQGAAVREKIEDLCGTLAWSAGRMPLLIVPFEASQRAIVAHVPADYRMIVYRRAMFRIGSALARQEKALGYITGDSLGQVASQTAENLRSIHAAADLPVYAPLIGSDKSEITGWARRVGTYDTSIRPHDDCCSFLVAKHPATKSSPSKVEAMEEGLPWDDLVAEAVEGTDRRVILPDPDMF